MKRWCKRIPCDWVLGREWDERSNEECTYRNLANIYQISWQGQTLHSGQRRSSIDKARLICFAKMAEEQISRLRHIPCLLAFLGTTTGWRGAAMISHYLTPMVRQALSGTWNCSASCCFVCSQLITLNPKTRGALLWLVCAHVCIWMRVHAGRCRYTCMPSSSGDLSIHTLGQWSPIWIMGEEALLLAFSFSS